MITSKEKYAVYPIPPSHMILKGRRSDYCLQNVEMKGCGRVNRKSKIKVCSSDLDISILAAKYLVCVEIRLKTASGGGITVRNFTYLVYCNSKLT